MCPALGIALPRSVTFKPASRPTRCARRRRSLAISRSSLSRPPGVWDCLPRREVDLGSVAPQGMRTSRPRCRRPKHVRKRGSSHRAGCGLRRSAVADLRQPVVVTSPALALHGDWLPISAEIGGIDLDGERPIRTVHMPCPDHGRHVVVGPSVGRRQHRDLPHLPVDDPVIRDPRRGVRRTLQPRSTLRVIADSTSTTRTTSDVLRRRPLQHSGQAVLS